MSNTTTPEGLLNITGLSFAPTFLSKPHYTGGKEGGGGGGVFGDIEGLRPFDKDLDESYVDVEPITGE